MSLITEYNPRATSSKADREPFRIPVEMPATSGNIEKVRAMLRVVNQAFAEQGINRRVRLFVGNREQQIA